MWRRGVKDLPKFPRSTLLACPMTVRSGRTGGRHLCIDSSCRAATAPPSSPSASPQIPYTCDERHTSGCAAPAAGPGC